MKPTDEIEVQELEPRQPGIGVADVLRMLFKHKWKLIAFTLLGIAGAAAIYFNHTAQYESTSKIFVRYVEEVSNVDPTENGRGRGGSSVDSVIGAEVEILQSWDLAKEVVDAVGPAVITRNAPEATRDVAAQAFLKALEVAAPKGGRVITVTYRHPEPDVAVKALSSLVSLYQKKHVEIHRATKSRETSRSRQSALTGRISDLSERIEQLKAENGISSLEEAANGLNKRSDELRAQLAAAEADLQEQKAKLYEITRLGLVKNADANAAEASTSAQAKSAGSDRAAFLEYEGIMKRLARLQEQQHALKERYAPGSQEMHQNREEIASADARRAEIEKQHPAVLSKGPEITPGAPLPITLDPTLETIRLATLSARVQLLKKRNDAMKDEFKQFSSVSKRLHEMERDREMQSEGLKQFAGTFQRTEFESPLTADQYDNIVVVQSSSPPVLALSKLFKLMAGVGLGLTALGLALIALLELVIDRSVKRPSEVETTLGIPLMCQIPRISQRRSALQNAADKANGKLVGIEAWSNNHFVRPFAEALRDRLVLYFEQVGLTRKPKLVAVSSYSRGAGVSTIASGIAAVLSETGEGKVLLVDMNTAHAAVHPFFEGRPAATLTEALESPDSMQSAAENLYLAKAANLPGRSAQLFPRRFYDMMPDFQASDFDYIIFDMPPMDESTLTLAMAGFMDKLLLVVESEKGNRDALKRASGELLRARAKLSGVLNKTRSYGPKWLQEA